MRWSHFIVLQCVLIAAVAGLVYFHKDRAILLKYPPPSLAQWYKPENKRQVWLHNMFNLRREMQAVAYYADNRDAERMDKWLTHLDKHYRKIGDMVPEWRKQLDLDALVTLSGISKERRFADIQPALDALNENCESCHTVYRAITAAIYRAPDFASMDISPTITLNVHMNELIRQVNQVKIALEDGMPDIAMTSLADLENGMNVLGEVCLDCHKQERKIYPGDTINGTITRLKQSLQTGTLKEQSEDLGTLAVQACATCHGTHRIVYDAGNMLSDRPGWRELLRH